MMPKVMVEADIHLRLLHTSILDIYKVFESLECCLKGMWVHPYTVTPAKLPQDVGSQGHLRNENDTITPWLRLISTPQTASYIHIRHIQKVFEALTYGLKGMWVHPYTVTPAKLVHIWGDSGSLDE